MLSARRHGTRCLCRAFEGLSLCASREDTKPKPGPSPGPGVLTAQGGGALPPPQRQKQRATDRPGARSWSRSRSRPCGRTGTQADSAPTAARTRPRAHAGGHAGAPRAPRVQRAGRAHTRARAVAGRAPPREAAGGARVARVPAHGPGAGPAAPRSLPKWLLQALEYACFSRTLNPREAALGLPRSAEITARPPNARLVKGDGGKWAPWESPASGDFFPPCPRRAGRRAPRTQPTLGPSWALACGLAPARTLGPGQRCPHFADDSATWWPAARPLPATTAQAHSPPPVRGLFLSPARGQLRPHPCRLPPPQEVPLPSSRPQGPSGYRLRGRGSLPVPAPSNCWSPLPFSGGPLPGEALGTCADTSHPAPLHRAPPSRPRQGHDSYPSLEAGTGLPRSLVYPRCPPPPGVRALQWQPDTASSIPPHPPTPSPKQSGSIRPRSRDVLGNPARPPAG